MSDDNKITTQDLHLKPVSSNETANEEITASESTPVEPINLAGQERQSIKQALERTRCGKITGIELKAITLSSTEA